MGQEPGAADAMRYPRKLDAGSRPGAEPFGLLKRVNDRCGRVFEDIDDIIPAEERNAFLGTHKAAAGFARRVAADQTPDGGTVFGYRVSEPERCGVVGFGQGGQVREIVETPEVPPSNDAVTGLYFRDGCAPVFAHTVKPSPRGELEIVDLLSI